MSAIDLAERGLIPDFAIRLGIRRLLRLRRATLTSATPNEMLRRVETFAAGLRDEPLAVATADANRQHYEVPTEFFLSALGPRMKYSCCLFTGDDTTLAEAELAMLRQTCDRAQLQDGQRVLELGCGWGSLSLWMAAEYPASEIVAVSNSSTQREYIESQAQAMGWKNLQVITADMRDFQGAGQFDRVVSVEMFEHMRNYQLLLQRVASWLKPDGKAFVHIFCHRDTPYLFESEGRNNWMGRHFFTGGMMPSEDLVQQFDQHLTVEAQWRVNGMHYWRTAEAWLQRLDRHRDALLARFRQDLTAKEASIQLQRWRIFFMACAELFRFEHGDEWFVAHYRMVPQAKLGDECVSRKQDQLEPIGQA